MAKVKIENELTTLHDYRIICPYCGQVYSDTGYCENKYEIKCYECESIFNLYVKHKLEYSTYKKEE